MSRIDAKSETYETEIQLDINTEIYPLHVGDKIEILLSATLDENDRAGQTGLGYDSSKELGKRAEEFEYIMRGVIFKYVEKKDLAMIYMSFGGLLMALKGESKVMLSHIFAVDSKVYLFVRKI